MSNYPVTPEENYDAICQEMKKIVEELDNNPNMPEDQFRNIQKRYGRLGKMLEEYGKMMWKK